MPKTSNPLMAMIEVRRTELMTRMEEAFDTQAVGEGSSTLLELTTIQDEMEFLAAISHVLHAQGQAEIFRLCDRTEPSH